MALPGYAVVARQNSEDETAVDHADDHGDENRAEAAFEQSTKEQKAEVAEDEPAGADVDRVLRRD